LCISYFKKKVKNRDFIINGNLSSLALKDEVLDTIIDISTSDHFNSNEFAITIKEYARVLKNHGLFILFHSNNDYYLLDIIKKSRFLRIPMYYRKDTEIERELTKYFTIRKKGFIFNLLLDPILTGTFFRIISRFLPKEFINLTIRINNKRLSPQVAYICQKIPNKNKN
jgi:SAM-dependent methyltransferase